MEAVRETLRLRLLRNERRAWVWRIEELIATEDGDEWALVEWGSTKTQLFARRKGRRRMWRAWLTQIRPSPEVEEVWTCVSVR